jgi:ribonuclease HI
MRFVEIYPDGACPNNGRKNAIGGWSFVIAHQDKVIKELFGKLRRGDQTNNRAELESTYQALLWLKNNHEKDTKYTIYSDSEVVVNGINGAAGRNANRDIWEGIELLCKDLREAKVITANSIKYVEAHQKDSTDYKHQMNCQADKLAKQGANSLLLEPVEIIKGDVLHG